MAKSTPKPPVAPPPTRPIGKLLAGVVLLVAIAGTVLYFAGRLPENVAGLLLAGGVVVLACGFTVNGLLGQSQKPTINAVVIVVGLAALAVAMAPVVTTLLPGEPLAKGELSAAGDTLPLPQDLDGRIRLLLHGNLGADSGAKTVEFAFDGTDPVVKGELLRTTSTARAGRRGYATIVHETNVEYLTGKLAAGSHKLTLRELEGKLAGSLEVSVFHDYVPFALALVIGAVLLVLVALMAAYLNTSNGPVIGVGLSVGFGLGVSLLATPDLAVRPTIGALLLGGVAGATLAALLFSLAKRFVQPPDAQESATGAG